MPSSLVHLGFALVLGVALLGEAFDSRAVAVLLAVLLFPELDTAAGLLIDGAHRALLHTMVLPLVVGVALYYDTVVRDRSWVAGRWGGYGVRLVWVALFVHVFAHVLLDYAHLEGVNLFYPLFDRFFHLDGELSLSPTRGVVQTFVEVSFESGADQPTVDAGATGSTDDTHVANPVQPDPDTGIGTDVGGETGEETTPEPVERRAPVAYWGWQLYLIATGAFVLLARRLQGDRPEP